MMFLALKYTLFAVIAAGMNILTQHACLSLYDGVYSLYLAILCGTATGFTLKYMLDKRYIFFFTTKTQTENVKKFILYTAIGGVITFIFWITEILFDYYLTNPNAKYVGAAIGLAIGYFSKYHLDKRFVFKKSSNNG